MHGSGPRWYLVKTARYKEAYVERQLIDFAGAGTYLPLAKIGRRYLRKGQAEIEPLFPGYVFAYLDLATQLFLLRRVREYDSLVRFGDQPACVDPEVVEALRRRENGRGYINLAVAARFRPHEAVRIAEGPFHGRTGEFLRYADGPGRVCILMEMLQSRAVLELPAHFVAAVA
jgi:transcriptional antiterminator RfaH